MRSSLLLAAAFAFSGCTMFMERAPDYAGRAMDTAADRTTDVAMDSAETKARQKINDDGSSSKEEASSSEKVTRKVDDDDVLVKDGNDFVVGKQIGSQILIVKTGQKVEASSREFVSIRPAKKGDLKVGTDVYFTTSKGDVRRAAWTLGSVTDNASLGNGTVAVGPESDLLWDGQVAVKR